MLEIERDASVPGEFDAGFERNVEEGAAAERLAVGSVGLEVPIMDGAADADAEEGPGRTGDLIDDAGVAVARGAARRDAGAEIGADRAPQNLERRRENDFAVERRAVLEIGAAPQAGHVVGKNAPRHLMDDAAAVGGARRKRGGRKEEGAKEKSQAPHLGCRLPR